MASKSVARVEVGEGRGRQVGPAPEPALAVPDRQRGQERARLLLCHARPGRGDFRRRRLQFRTVAQGHLEEAGKGRLRVNELHDQDGVVGNLQAR